MTTPAKKMVPGYYLATHTHNRPGVVEFVSNADCAPHWRNIHDDRMHADPRDHGYELTPIVGRNAIPSSAAVLPREVVEKIRGLLDKAAVEIASTGAPFTHGKYDKNGEWSFAAMTENGNPADAAAIKAGFLLLQEATDLLPPTGAGVGE